MTSTLALICIFLATTSLLASAHTHNQHHQHRQRIRDGHEARGAAPATPSVGLVWPDGVPTIASNSLSPAQSAAFFHPLSIQAPLIPLNIPSGTGSLSQQLTNGNSNLGTFLAPTFATFLAAAGKFVSGLLNVAKINPYTTTVSSGTTRSYKFEITRANLAPDGVQRSMLLINGQFPGPTIEANYGDTISVTVTNSITGPEDGTAFHWHGMLQKATPWADGVPGIHQCPIAPGETFTYTFTADIYGTSWYHSHYSAQYAGGLLGAMIIHGPQTAAYDIDLGPVLLTDYYHQPYNEILKNVMGNDLRKIRAFSDNTLINGKGNYNCSLVTNPSVKCTPNAGLAKFQFTRGKTHRLRLINAGAEGVQKFSIDGHSMQVISNDFVEIVPYTTSVVTLAVGQRADVLVTANAVSNGPFWMRSTQSACSLALQPNGLAMVYYSGATSTSAIPSTSAVTDKTDACANDALSLSVPQLPLSVNLKPSATITMALGFRINATGHFLWTVNDSSFRVNYNDPLLTLANKGTMSYSNHPEWNIYNLGTNDTVRFLIYNPTPAPHPMHIHGHNMYILASGYGLSWDGKITNPTNPLRRDVHLLPPMGYMVMQIDVDNPGVWPFHCHIAWHVSGGLYVNLLERPKSIAQLTIPSDVLNTCSSWKAWTDDETVDMIDSGLRKRDDDDATGESKSGVGAGTGAGTGSEL